MGELRRLTADDLPAIRAAVVVYRDGLAEHLESGEQLGNFTGAEALEDVLGEPRTDPDVPGVAGYKYVPVNLYQAELSRELVDALKDLWCRLRLYDTKTQKYELFAAIDDVIRKINRDVNRGTQRRKKRSSDKVKPLTPRQSEAIQIVGECKGNFADAARRMGLDRTTVKQHYDAGMKKLGRKPIQHGTQSVPFDRRGQVHLSPDDDQRQ